MTLIEAAETILGRNKGSARSAREIAEEAIAEGLIKPKSSKPWVHLQAAIRERNHQLAVAGKKEQFSFTNGKWKLN